MGIEETIHKLIKEIEIKFMNIIEYLTTETAIV
jgi:hypothetical protein